LASQSSMDNSTLELPKLQLADLLATFRPPPGLEDCLTPGEVQESLRTMSASNALPTKQPLKEACPKKAFLTDLAASLSRKPSENVLPKPKALQLSSVAEVTKERHSEKVEPEVLNLSGCLHLKEEEVPTQGLTAQSDLDLLPSIGSAYHYSGRCKPCVFFHCANGCENGHACLHCHLCAPGEKKRRRKQVKQLAKYLAPQGS